MYYLLRSSEIAGPVILILLLVSAASAEQRSQAFSPAESFPEPPDAAAFEFSSGGFQHKIAGNGKGHRSKNGKRLALRLRVDRNEYLTHKLYYADYEGDLLLIGEVSNGDYGMGFIARLDGVTLRMKWKRVIPGFN